MPTFAVWLQAGFRAGASGVLGGATDVGHRFLSRVLNGVGVLRPLLTTSANTAATTTTTEPTPTGATATANKEEKLLQTKLPHDKGLPCLARIVTVSTPTAMLSMLVR